MEDKEEIIEMTPFIFEDGITYYFNVLKRGSSTMFHDLFVYEKVITKTKSFWRGEETKESFSQINKSPELIDIGLNTKNVKDSIKKALLANKAIGKLKDWDGFVGDIPDNIKTSLKRDGKLKSLLGE